MIELKMMISTRLIAANDYNFGGHVIDPVAITFSCR